MQLCVGATSRRVVEVAASLGVHQIVASCGQVEGDHGYTGMTPEELVGLVRTLSDGRTEVIRDHGGPDQGRDPYLETLHRDVEAGFHGLHLDVCKLRDYEEQNEILKHMLHEFAGAGVTIEVGAEHAEQERNDELLELTLSEGVTPSYVVTSLGTRVWADRQCGSPIEPLLVNDTRDWVRERTGDETKTKAHNADWVGDRVARYGDVMDAYNLAPELGCLETDLILTVMPPALAAQLLEEGYAGQRWRRWFKSNEGTWFDRAKCGIRYSMGTSGSIKDLIDEWFTYEPQSEKFVRDQLAKHIELG